MVLRGGILGPVYNAIWSPSPSYPGFHRGLRFHNENLMKAFGECYNERVAIVHSGENRDPRKRARASVH
jgi:hypothetical protein